MTAPQASPVTQGQAALQYEIDRIREARAPLTFAEVDAAFRVEGSDLVRKVARGSTKAGDRVCRVNRDGYVAVSFKGRGLLAHRVIWLLSYGCWPASMLDHINGQRLDNSIGNLREATNSQNQQNRKIRNAFKGVATLPHGRFQAQCGKSYLGSFDTAEEAARVYDREALKRYGEFARINFGDQA